MYVVCILTSFGVLFQKRKKNSFLYILNKITEQVIFSFLTLLRSILVNMFSNLTTSLVLTYILNVLAIFSLTDLDKFRWLASRIYKVFAFPTVQYSSTTMYILGLVDRAWPNSLDERSHFIYASSVKSRCKNKQQFRWDFRRSLA